MENAIKIHVPIAIFYSTLEELIKKKMVGEYIPPPEKGANEPPYAQILDIRLAGREGITNEVILNIKLKILRTVLKRDQVDLKVQAQLAYDNATQLLYVRQFKLDSSTSSGFYNTALEVLANKVAYSQILNKARFSIGDIISKETDRLNVLLQKGLELKGIKLAGTVEVARVLDIRPLQDRLTLSVELQGNLEASIFDLLSLMPDKSQA